MKPSELKQLIILDYLSGADRNIQYSKIYEQLSSKLSAEQLNQELVEMDLKHQKLLNISFMPTLSGNVPSRDANYPWLTSKGDDRLYELKNPDQSSTVSTNNYNFNGPVNSNGSQNFGNIHAQNLDESTTTIYKSWNTDSSIHKIIEVKQQLSDIQDQQTLQELADILKNVLDNQEPPKPGFLSKFSGFLDKTWKITSPVIAPVLAELAKRSFVGG
ncbi:hypothetical protein [Lactiplantibacillus pentosus]|uniref:hypothetical protein n=1 Tax=Lactiplantibacillus pentosus TaxID=1589 RepID=UPI003D2F05D8